MTQQSPRANGGRAATFTEEEKASIFSGLTDLRKSMDRRFDTLARALAHASDEIHLLRSDLRANQRVDEKQNQKLSKMDQAKIGGLVTLAFGVIETLREMGVIAWVARTLGGS